MQFYLYILSIIDMTGENNMKTILFFIIVTAFMWVPFILVGSVFIVAVSVDAIDLLHRLFNSEENNNGRNN